MAKARKPEQEVKRKSTSGCAKSSYSRGKLKTKDLHSPLWAKQSSQGKSKERLPEPRISIP